MRSTFKTATLESKIPILNVENGFIVSKEADITAAFRIELPEAFTLSADDYEIMHAS